MCTVINEMVQKNLLEEQQSSALTCSRPPLVSHPTGKFLTVLLISISDNYFYQSNMVMTLYLSRTILNTRKHTKNAI